jgi:NAD(P)H-hydrate epimerase
MYTTAQLRYDLMIMSPLSRAVTRDLDRRAIEEFGIPGIALMENAGAAAARWLIELGVNGPVVICCGKGNNGGDGYVIARHLDARHHPVHVLLTCDPAELTGDALVNYNILERSAIPVTRWNPLDPDARIAHRLRAADWLVDALLGTGISGLVREPIARAIRDINASSARKLAIDIPSGLDCDTGQPCGIAIRADFTATFVATKLGFSQPSARTFTGVVRVFDIGICRRLLEEYAGP